MASRDPAALAGTRHEVMQCPRPDGQEYHVRVVSIGVERVERREQQQRPGRHALSTFGEVADQHPRAPQANTRVQAAQKCERPSGTREHGEPQAAYPGPERRMLIVAELKFVPPGIRFRHVVLDRDRSLGDREIQSPMSLRKPRESQNRREDLLSTPFVRDAAIAEVATSCCAHSSTVMYQRSSTDHPSWPPNVCSMAFARVNRQPSAPCAHAEFIAT